ncbi:MAG: SdpI family protein [Turicibacter sp.]|nr:SdpI family protein [Turicibacter sp.]
MQEFSIFIAPLLFMFFGLVTYLESDLPHRRLGYRVLSVKQTVETWRVSNKFAAKLLLIVGGILLVIGVFLNSYFRTLAIWELIIINLVEITVMALLVVGLTEWRVHMSFDKEGNRK